MPIKVPCPGCKKVYTLGDHLTGKKVRCKACQTSFLVRAPAAEDETKRPMQEEVRPVTPRKTATSKAASDRRLEHDDEREDEKDDERPRRRKTRSKKTEPATWGKVLTGVVSIVFGAVAYMISRGAFSKKDQPAPRPLNLPINPNVAYAPAGLHVAIINELNACVKSSGEILATARDVASIEAAGEALLAESKKIDALTDRVKASERASPADRRQVLQAAKEAIPLIQKYNQEFEALRAAHLTCRKAAWTSSTLAGAPTISPWRLLLWLARPRVSDGKPARTKMARYALHSTVATQSFCRLKRTSQLPLPFSHEQRADDIGVDVLGGDCLAHLTPGRHKEV